MARGTTQVIAEPGTPQIVITRDFTAPPKLLFRAYTEPELLVQWLGPRRLTMAIDRYDLRHGGTWRYVHRETDGTEYGFHGVFHGTPSLDGIVQTFEFEGVPGHVSLDSVTFEIVDERTTRLRMNSVYQSVADRDGMIQSGMEQGVNEGLDRLEELLVRLAAGR
jgi:uncharacterized protein YndB with AHSA1/START domain